MGSLQNGAPATTSQACKSNFIEYGMCAEGYKLLGSNGKEGPTVCTNECHYENSNKQEKTLDCTCGMTETGKGYCKILEGDLNFTDVLFSIND